MAVVDTATGPGGASGVNLWDTRTGRVCLEPGRLSRRRHQPSTHRGHLPHSGNPTTKQFIGGSRLSRGLVKAKAKWACISIASEGRGDGQGQGGRRESHPRTSGIPATAYRTAGHRHPPPAVPGWGLLAGTPTNSSTPRCERSWRRYPPPSRTTATSSQSAAGRRGAGLWKLTWPPPTGRNSPPSSALAP